MSKPIEEDINTYIRRCTETMYAGPCMPINAVLEMITRFYKDPNLKSAELADEAAEMRQLIMLSKSLPRPWTSERSTDSNVIKQFTVSDPCFFPHDELSDSRIRWLKNDYESFRQNILGKCNKNLDMESADECK